MEYAPNRLARALRFRQMNAIGLYLVGTYLDVRSPFAADIVYGIQLGCNEHGKDLLIHGTFRGSSTEDIYSELIGGRIDGLVMVPVREDPLSVRLAESSLPVVAIADAEPNLPSVVVDDVGGTMAAVTYLAERGHRLVYYRKGSITKSSTIRRHRAFLDSAARYGMKVIDDIRPPNRPDGPLSDWERALLAGPVHRRPTAVVCHRDGAAYPVVDYCISIGLRVPEDIAIIGFDGFQPEITPAINLTTVRAPWVEVGRVAVDLLVKRLAGEECPAETILPVEFVVGSTA